MNHVLIMDIEDQEYVWDIVEKCLVDQLFTG